MIYGNNDGYVFKLEHWRALENRHDIRCGRCPAHRKENYSTHDKRKAHRSWKFRTRALRQFKPGQTSYDWPGI